MRGIIESQPFLLIAILALSVLAVIKPALAQTCAPTVPQFKVKYVDNSYDVLPTYGIDPYTGQTIITGSGSQVDNRTIEVTIKNPPFTPYTDSNNLPIQLYHDVRSKGHF